MKKKIFLMTAILSAGMLFPMTAAASSYMAGEALIEENTEKTAAQDTRQNTEQSIVKSSDANLKKLVLEPGTLSPEFSAEVTDYTFVLEDNNMNQVILNAKTKNKKAEIIAVSGFTNLKVGDNLAVLTVKAEDGTTRSYHVTITRNQGEVEAEAIEPAAAVSEEGYIQTGQENLVVHKEFADELVPSGCVKVEYSYKGHYVDAAYFEEGELILLYASAADGSNENFYVYYSGSDEYFEFVPFESSNGLLVFPVQYPTGIPIPNYFTEASIDYNGTVIAGYTVSESFFEEEEEYTDMEVEEEESTYTLPEYTEYFLFFGISSEGNKGWYLYDMMENTCQRYLDLTADVTENVFDEESYVIYKEKSQQRMVAICVLVFVVLIFLVILLNQFLKIRELKSQLPEEDDLEPEEELPAAVENVVDDTKKTALKTPTENTKKAAVKTKKSRETKTFSDDGKEKLFVKGQEKKENKKLSVNRAENQKRLEAGKKTERETKANRLPEESRPEVKINRTLEESRPETKEKPLSPDLDDDFEFEFIDISR